MKLNSVKQVNEFLKVIDSCVGSVWMESPEGDRINLKSEFSRYIAISALILNHGNELELYCNNPDDEFKFYNLFEHEPNIVDLELMRFLLLKRNKIMRKKKYSCQKICRNGADSCGCDSYEDCVRFMPLDGTNLTRLNGTVETPPEIDDDKFCQYFINWIESMGWSFCGSVKRYKEDKE